MCCNNYDWLSIIISILFGAIIGILFAFGFIPGIVIATWISFGLAVLTLIFLVTGVFLGAVTRSQILWRCLRAKTEFLLVGIVGTLITSLAALSIILLPSISVIILVAIGAFFFALMIIGLIFLIKCIVCSMNCC